MTISCRHLATGQPAAIAGNALEQRRRLEAPAARHELLPGLRSLRPISNTFATRAPQRERVLQVGARTCSQRSRVRSSQTEAGSMLGVRATATASGGSAAGLRFRRKAESFSNHPVCFVWRSATEIYRGA